MIRKATYEDMNAIKGIYRAARKYMAENGNPTQWGEDYPSEELTGSDIRNGNLYVIEDNDGIHGVFVFILGKEPNYSNIENGEWKNDNPYGTIHRMASDGTTRGVFEKCMAFCKGLSRNLRIDTHAANGTMMYLIEKNGFEKCGTIYVEDGTPRIAYQYTE